MTYQSLLRPWVAALGLALATAACGKDERISGGVGGAGGSAGGDAGEAGAAGAGPDHPSSCPGLELGSGRFFFNVFGELTGLRYPLSNNLGDPELADYVLIELYDSTSPSGNGFLPPLESGSFDLSVAPDDDLTTCQHCVSLVTDVMEGTDADGFPLFQPARWYYARSGEMRLDEVHDPLNESPENTALFGNVSNVELAEVDLNDPSRPFLPSSECFLVAETSFDTRPKPGAACEDLDDCGNELLEVCDPDTLSCTDEVQCGLDFPCEDGGFCIQQSPLSAWGACYPRCTPFASGSCPEGRACVQYGISEVDGYCLTIGNTALGAACEAKDAVTGCAGDAVCLDTCVSQCGFFSGTPACPDSGVCDVLGHCRSAADGDTAALGEACHDSAALADACARNAGRFDGICFGYDPATPLVCGKSCFVDENDYNDGNADDGDDDLDCAPGEFCALRFSSGLGICRPDPVCGDGAFGEVGETCDDGNTESGDGCSADCQTVEYGPLCAAAENLATDGNVEGTTEGGVDGFMGSCQFGVARAHVYSIDAPGPGQLRLLLASDTAQIVSVRSDCAAAESELGCGESTLVADEASLVLELTQTPSAPFTVLVTALTVLDEGPFSLSAEFTPQLCGDELKVGAEACDDGNVQGGDGCSADCSNIEYDYWCDNAETLPLNSTVSGELGGQYSLFFPSCGYGNAPDTLYRIAAASAGTLTVRLVQTEDVALFALDACGAPDTVSELDCSSVYDTEELVVNVVKGQEVFFVVDGLNNATATFQISAELQ